MTKPQDHCGRRSLPTAIRVTPIELGATGTDMASPTTAKQGRMFEQDEILLPDDVAFRRPLRADVQVRPDRHEIL